MAKGKNTKKAAKKPAADKAPKRGRKETRTTPGAGHNLASLRKAGANFAERFMTLCDSMDSDMAGYRADIKVLYEEAANETGLKKSVVTKELKRIRANKKAAEAEAEMAPDERAQTTMWRAAMEDTKWGQYSQGDLFPAVGPATGEEIEEAGDGDDNASEDDISHLGDD